MTIANDPRVAAAQAFSDEVIAPNAEHWETLGRVPYDYFEKAAQVGLCGLLVPEALGGSGLGVGAMAAVMESMAKACMASAFSFAVHNNLAGYVARYGNARQIERYLPDLIAGRKIGAFLLTEPGAGSDAQSIQTFAKRTAGGWLISGEKAWVSNGVFADVLSVYVQTEQGAGAKGIAAFLIDANAQGVIREDPYKLMRGHALGTTGFRFDQCEVSDDSLVLAPGTAFKAAIGGINIARICVAAMCCGTLQASLAQAVDYADNRRAFGQSTLAFQGLQFMLAEAATNLEAAKLLTASAIERYDAGMDATIDAAHAKKFATRAAFDGIGDCMQAMGAAGYSAEYSLGRHLAAAKMAQFLDGTTEIQNVVIGRGLKSIYGSR
ncbi:MAG: alkylation response protein AidB-like acyl-CoA dehydrogenase [Gammaproteobacteria bacterium]|jgi:alkylation response protein AidB-like acyl-CoA dehydrogenase